MQVTVFGASGKVGSLVVRRLLAQGYHVVAFVHSHNSFTEQPALRVVRGDIYNSHDITRALEGSCAVMSALSSWHSQQKNILMNAMTHILPAMKSHGLRRIISLTGSDARDIDDKPGILQQMMHATLGVLAPKILHDSEEHLRLLHDSGLDWTVIRSPVMADFGATGHYRLSRELTVPWQTIARSDVAQAMVEQLDRQDFIQSAPAIFRR
jgi:putative NADH-flavin reductase